MIPGIEPTGRYVELPHVVVMKFKGNKIEHEHIYWDQASLLTQIGLFDAKGLPIKGIEQSEKLKELSSMQDIDWVRALINISKVNSKIVYVQVMDMWCELPSCAQDLQMDIDAFYKSPNQVDDIQNLFETMWV